MRLIDADDLKTKIMIGAPDFMNGGSSITKAFIMAMLGSRAATPTIDAVPVVRCKDCKYCTEAADKKWRQDFEKSIYECNHMNLNFVEPDWFCADGERQEGR